MVAEQLGTGQLCAMVHAYYHSMLSPYPLYPLSPLSSPSLSLLSIPFLPPSSPAGPPGPVNNLVARATNRTQLFISWYCPEVANIHDLALLRYNIFYQEGSEFNSASAVRGPVVRPLLLNGAESDPSICIVESSIPDLSVGVQYAVKIVASSPNSPGEESSVYALATTYGTGEPLVV